jgi:outer membrane biosynthesis protein TonB
MKYPEEAIKRNASFGRTVVSFTVKTDGILDKFTITEDPGFGMVDQLVGVVKNMPK